MSRPNEEVSLDPWADVLAGQEKRMQLADERTWALKEREAQRKHERRKFVWSGVGYFSVGALIVAFILGLFLIFANIANHNANKVAKREVQKTEQLNLCMDIEEPTERQLCLLAISVEELDSGN